MPDPILVGRSEDKLKEALREDLGEEIHHRPRQGPRRPAYSVYFDAQTTGRRADAVKAVAAGKHVYCEKPTAVDVEDRSSSTKSLQKGRRQKRRRAGQALAPRPAQAQAPHRQPASSAKSSACAASSATGSSKATRASSAQRPSWNYRKEDDGGIIVDMLCHWRYVLDNLFGEVKAVSCLGATHIPSASTRTASPTNAPPTIPPTPPSSSKGGVIATSIPRGPCASAATTCSPCRSTAPTAAPSPACANATSSTTATRPRPTWNPDVAAARSTSSTAGPRCPSRKPTTTPSRSSGNSSCATSRSTNRSAGPSARRRQGRPARRARPQGTPDDVGRAAASLARGDFPYSTGSVIMIDGGLIMPRL
jgi:hypothetical protein